MTGFINKVKEAVTHDKHEQASHSTNAGPHDSNMANKADPRVDSDRDGRLAHGTTGTTTGMNTGMNNTNTFAGNEYGAAGSTNAGPHNTNMGNKMDPRIDSDLDGRAAYGNSGYGHTGMNTGTTTTGNTYGATGSTNAGPHNSNMMNKADPRVDSDLDGRAVHGNTGYGNTGMSSGAAAPGTAYGSAGSTNAGPHNTNMGNKMDPRIDSDLDGRANHRHTGYNNATGVTTGAAAGAAAGAYGAHGTHGTHDTHGTHGTHNTHSANNGPHNSKLMNKLDPRVDSEQYGANTYDSNTYGSNHHGTNHHGTRGAFNDPNTTTKSFEQSQTESTPTSTTAHGVGSSNHGPHNSNMMNKMDPRVDSDRDHRAAHGGMTGHSAGTTMGAGAMGTGATGAPGTGHVHYNRDMEAGAMGAGAAGVAHTHGHHSQGMGAGAAPHNSAMANEMDPRFDNGMTTGHNYNTRSTNAGPHDSNMVNKMDPRIDSDMDNRARHQQMGTGTGVPAGSSYANTGVAQSGANTAGPHKSNLMNKLDPRVDSDLDNSRTVGNTQRQY